MKFKFVFWELFWGYIQFLDALITAVHLASRVPALPSQLCTTLWTGDPLSLMVGLAQVLSNLIDLF